MKYFEVVTLLFQDGDDVTPILDLLTMYQLPLKVNCRSLPKLNNKQLGFAILDLNADDNDTKQILLLEKNKLYLLQQSDNGELLKVHNDWEGMTRRIVTAGRKSELLLQACKLDNGMQVIDGTAGFGHDSLILASSGASVLMLEQNPVVALLLYAEKQRMQANKNWQGLLSRLLIHHADLLKISTKDLTGITTADRIGDGVDMVYLDPMFPKDSYSAKVGKNMQALHRFISPPDLSAEIALLDHAKGLLKSSGSVIVKRPIGAPNLGQITPVQSWQNDAVRFDKYLPSS